jgi:hypothetical protein
VQSVLFPEGICYRKDIGFFAPVTNELEAVVFKCLLDLSAHEGLEPPTSPLSVVKRSITMNCDGLLPR